MKKSIPWNFHGKQRHCWQDQQIVGKFPAKVFFIKMCRCIEKEIFCEIVLLLIKLPLHKISKNGVEFFLHWGDRHNSF